MAAVKALAFAALLASPGNARADRVNHWAADIAEASSRFNLPQQWISAVMQAESGGRSSINGQPVVSRAGAMGLMQLMPATWQDMRALLGLGADPFDPHDNILAGAAYLRLMYDRFGFPAMFAAYNLGPGRFAKSISRPGPLPRETKAYMVAVAKNAERRASSDAHHHEELFAVASDDQFSEAAVRAEPAPRTVHIFGETRPLSP